MKRYTRMSLLLLLILLLAVTTVALAQSPSSYELPWYVWGAGGGSSDSANYHLDQTRGQTFVGYTVSSNYQLGVGYWYGASKSYRVFLPIVLKNYASSTELTYDDGVAESSQSYTAGSGFAVLFTAPGASAKLVTARYYFIAPVAPIEVHVWDTGHNDLITPFAATPGGDGWLDVDLSSYGLTVSGDFYVGFLYTVDTDPTLGVDTSSPDGRSYEVPWQAFGNDYMIHAVVVP